jgi:hypothetical protein
LSSVLELVAFNESDGLFGQRQINELILVSAGPIEQALPISYQKVATSNDLDVYSIIFEISCNPN